MTDAIISVVVEQLASFVQQEVKLVLSVRKDVNALTSTLQMLQAVLHDAEIKEEAVRLWLDKLKAIVYDAEDVLDEWNTRNHKPLIQGVDDDDDVHLHKKVFFCCLSPCFSSRSIVVRYDIGSRIKDIRERLDAIANEKEKFKLNESQIHEEPRERLTYSFIDVPHTYSCEQAKIDLVNLLLGESSAQAMNTNVISIVGKGGFGKTTLANLVLEEGKVKEIFEKRIFVCVSEPFQLLKVARSIIEQITGMAPSVNEREPVLQGLRENLKGKRFLVVLDDVWTEDTNDWSPLKLAFDGGAQGSWVIVTTRSKKVAEMMHSNYIHNLAELSDLDSWLLFEHIAFAGRQEELSKFEEIGKKIAAKCKGVPLVIRIVGSYMRSIKTKNEWNSVLKSKVWEIEEIEKKISPSFFLSYNPLPSKLKQCFMFCAIFPKDKRLYKDELVKLWMAQSFLGSGGHKNLEKIGCNYFDDLAMHSFFQDFWKGPEGNIISCKMHDLVHDFAQFLTKGECSFLEDSEELDGINVRHLVTESLESSSIFMAKNLRTLLITESVNSDQLINIFNQLKRIRILDLSNSWMPRELPKQVKELLHLRYLDLSKTKLVELPETICHLFNLQTLKLNQCTQLIKLPGGIGKLLNLRHLELEDTDALNCIPRGIGRLRFLRSLCKFIVGDVNNGCNIKELKDLCYLRGSLEIIGLERVVDASEAAQAELKNKPIDILSLVFKSLLGEEDSENMEQGESEKMTSVLENLQPHEDVAELNIYSFRGSRFPSWISMLANLLRLTLSEFDHTTKLSALGNLPSLEELTLKGMKSVKHIGREFYGLGVAFPKLKKLEIEEMDELVEWEIPVLTDARIIMPCLQILILSECPMLRALPPSVGKLESLERLKISQLSQVKYIGQEFYGFDDDNDTSNPGDMVVAFPQLKVLEIGEMNELVEWELPIARDNKKIMPCLSRLLLFKCPMLRALPGLGTLESLEDLRISGLPCLSKLELSNCPMLRALPSLGTLESLEILEIKQLSQVKYIGQEFYGFDDVNNTSNPGVMVVAFPQLKVLKIKDMNELVEWELPIARDNMKIMPCLSGLELRDCPMLRALPGLGRLESLEDLSISGLPMIKQVGFEFMGFFAADGCSMDVAFPKLKVLEINSLAELVEWEIPIAKDNKKIMLCLSKLELSNCPMLRALPGLGTLESLQILKIKQLSQVKYIGQEFYGFDDDNDTSNPGVMVVAFPQLKVLEIEEMNELVEWELPIARDNKKIMPCLNVLKFSKCPMMRALPGLGTLESLESLSISELPMIKQVGFEFLGISAGDGCSMDVAFPQLKVLEIKYMNELVEWELPIARDNKKIMPCLSVVKLLDCPKLRALPCLGTLESLESLSISELPSIKEVGLEFLGISAADEFGGGGGEKEPVILFPKLTELQFEWMRKWEVWILPPFQEDIQIMPRLTKLDVSRCFKLRALPDLTRFKSLEILSISGPVELEREEEEGIISLLPCLRELTLSFCTSLRVIPGYLFPHTLRKLDITDCPELRGVQPCLPPLLESLDLWFDVGVFSESLPIAEEEEEENNNNYPNLKKVKIYFSKHPSLPKGFNHLTAIQYLKFDECESLDFDLNELKHLTMLRVLDIYKCPILAKRFQSSGDDWMTILSHVPKIIIDSKDIRTGEYCY